MEVGAKFEYQEPTIEQMYKGWCWDAWKPAYPLKPGYTMYLKDNFTMSENVSCMNGHTREYCITDENGIVVASGTTCACGRGCYGLDCISDEWGYHDTSVEDFRADEENNMKEYTFDEILQAIKSNDQACDTDFTDTHYGYYLHHDGQNIVPFCGDGVHTFFVPAPYIDQIAADCKAEYSDPDDMVTAFWERVSESENTDQFTAIVQEMTAQVNRWLAEE